METVSNDQNVKAVNNGQVALGKGVDQSHMSEILHWHFNAL